MGKRVRRPTAMKVRNGRVLPKNRRAKSVTFRSSDGVIRA